MSAGSQQNPSNPPPAAGVRLHWQQVPGQVRAAAEQWFASPVTNVTSQSSGFSPGVAARFCLADGRRLFVKAVGSAPNAESPRMHRREGQIVAALPADAPVPRLLWSYDDPDSGWVVLVFEDVEGRHPAQPWRLDELDRVLDAHASLCDALTPSPLPVDVVGTLGEQLRRRFRGWQRLLEEQPSYVDRLDAWSACHLPELVALEDKVVEAVAGDTLLHFDIRGDNILLTPERVWFVDWPLACVGAAWADVVFFAPSVQMQGGPSPEYLMERHPACRQANPEALTAAVASVAGFFIYNALQPPPPGLPTLRAFQAAQGVVARQWLAQRTGWT